MARTIITDAMEKKYNGVTIKGNVKDAVQYVNNGTICNTFVTVDNLFKYNAIDDVQCVFGAKSSKSFQYSMLVKLTDYIGIYEKELKKKENGKEKGKGKTLSTIKVEINAMSRLYTLASYGWKVQKRKDGLFILTTPYQNKLTSFRRIMNGNENYFDIESISVNRFDGKDLLNYLNLNKKDIIKECQNQNRDFVYKWISNRIDKAWN